ncbi:MAG: hypothetical protein KGM91_15280, partial [Burkholderiales bacterium]|nr:hypothetical protein [Burkholderiales bacterium]
ARAALEGTTLKALVLALVEQGLAAPAAAAPGLRSEPPTVSIGGPWLLGAAQTSNAGLMEHLDDGD